MTAPRRPSEQATIRGAIVVFVAVLIGVALLSRSDGGIFGSAEAGSAGPTSSTTTTEATTTSPSSTVPTQPGGGGGGGGGGEAQAHPPGEVKVIVINAAGGIPGIGQENTDKVAQAGFAVLPVKNSEEDVDTTGLFFREGYEADAAAVKEALGFGDVPVQAAPEPPLIPEAAEANVAVVLGQNYQAAIGG